MAYTGPGADDPLATGPRDLGALARVLADRGVDIMHDLRERVMLWPARRPKDHARLNGTLALIVSMPVVAPNGDRPGLLDLRVFITLKSVGEIGVALGILLPDQDENAASGFRSRDSHPRPRHHAVG